MEDTKKETNFSKASMEDYLNEFKKLPGSVNLHLLLDFADGISYEKKPVNFLAATFIYGACAEYIAVKILEIVEVEIRFCAKNSTVTTAGTYHIDVENNAKNRNQGKTNLSATIKSLKVYIFPDKYKIISLLGRISKNRDLLFHNLIGAWKVKNASREQIANQLRTDTFVLYNIYLDVAKKLYGNR